MGAGVDPLIGRLVDDRYAVVSRIARGGMATVYLALDRRLDREVALKVMHAHLAADPQFTARFIREARAAARLSHPGIVAVFDQGEDAGLLYLAMEYLAGRTLREVLDELGVLTPGEALDVLEPVLEALAAAHAAGIVHRDVKPENVILTDDGRVKVADFGLARAASAVTATSGVLMGTAAYLAPELVLRGVADARGDVYAVGVVLFELLTGVLPFAGDVPVQVAYRHVHEEVPPPSSVVRALPPALDVVVSAAAARDPGRRPADAGALLALVRSARTRVPASALGVRPPAPALRPAPGRTQALGTPTTPHPTQALLTTTAPHAPWPLAELGEPPDGGPGAPGDADDDPAGDLVDEDDLDELDEEDDPLAPVADELRRWGRRRRRRGVVGLLAVLGGAAALATWAWELAAGRL
ncbi:MAG TPA: protein kinase [Kineosporiaceae bacterium]|nr:protein kinase [Kineosporiaceae bacterium]